MKTETFGVFVTSNASLTHIIFGDAKSTPCGLENESIEKQNCKHPASEIRDVMDSVEFSEYVKTNRVLINSELRFCKRCLKAYDKLFVKK